MKGVLSEHLGEYQDFDAIFNRQRDLMDRCRLLRTPEVPGELFEEIYHTEGPHPLEAATPLGWTTLSVYYSTNNDGSSKAIPVFHAPPSADHDTAGIPLFIRDNYRVELVDKRPYGFEIGLPDKIAESQWTGGIRALIGKGDAKSSDIFSFLGTFPNLNAPNLPVEQGEIVITANRRTKPMAAIMIRLSDEGVPLTYACTPDKVGSSVSGNTLGHNFVQVGNINGPYTRGRHVSIYNDYDPSARHMYDPREIERLRQTRGHLAEVIVMAGTACRYSDIQFCWSRRRHEKPIMYDVSLANNQPLESARSKKSTLDETLDNPRTTVLGIKDLKPIAAFRVAVTGLQRIHYEEWI